MKLKFLIAVVATIAPLSLCQDLIVNPQLQNVQQPLFLGPLNRFNGYGDLTGPGSLNSINSFGSDITNSNSQAQAQAQAQAQSNSFQDQSAIAGLNAQQLPAYLNALQTGPSFAGVAGLPAVAGYPVLSGLGVPGAASALPSVNPYAGQEAIQESLAETNLANNIRNGAVQVVPPNLSSQAVLQSVHVPVPGRYGNTVYSTQPLPPMVVTQPGSPTIQISSGPAAVVRASPVIYSQPRNVVYQNEIINRHPAPLSLNPVYVKVYKPGKKVVAPNPNAVNPNY